MNAPITEVSGDPRTACREWLSVARQAGESLLHVRFELPQYWSQESFPQALTALYLWREGVLALVVSEKEFVPGTDSPGEQFDSWTRGNGLFVADCDATLPLAAMDIAKPWGRERWYTGIEARGVCHFGDTRCGVPLPWLLAALPSAQILAPSQAPLLLKILEPFPEPVTGDLYFELHAQKQEVYVVTHVDPRAWPDGVGYLRYGFCPRRLAACDSEAVFRSNYLAAVEAYRAVREQIDDLPAEQLPGDDLLSREAGLRAAMDDFTWLKPVSVGDVVQVPRLLPHALQHGVRVVEFQTPVYERKILSFGQRVLTQGHWDTEEAVDQMLLRPPAEKSTEILLREEQGQVERVADAPGFEVRRIQVEPGSRLTLTAAADYALLIVIQGEIHLSGRRYGPEQAAWLPGPWRTALQVPQDAGQLVLLLALPRS
jgi:hypothetical protein